MGAVAPGRHPNPGTHANRKETPDAPPTTSRHRRPCPGFAAPAFAQEAPSPLPAEVAASVAAYDGKCPCPYTLNAKGKPCGGTSGYSRTGGQFVVCFVEDLSALPPCEAEDGENCVWNAATQGNGSGRSFRNIAGQLFDL